MRRRGVSGGGKDSDGGKLQWRGLEFRKCRIILMNRDVTLVRDIRKICFRQGPFQDRNGTAP